MIIVGSTTSADALADSSSAGPSVEGRLKPDLTAPGVLIRSAWATSDNAYQTLSGTKFSFNFHFITLHKTNAATLTFRNVYVSPTCCCKAAPTTRVYQTPCLTECIIVNIFYYNYREPPLSYFPGIQILPTPKLKNFWKAMQIESCKRLGTLVAEFQAQNSQITNT